MNGKGVLELNRIGIGRTAEVFEIDNEKILKLFDSFYCFHLPQS